MYKRANVQIHKHTNLQNSLTSPSFPGDLPPLIESIASFKSSKLRGANRVILNCVERHCEETYFNLK